MQMLDIDTSTIELLDFAHTPACEGITHSLGLHGHEPEAPAMWVLTMPCCGPKILVCDARRTHILSDGDILCSTHDLMVDTSTIKFTPIS